MREYDILELIDFAPLAGGGLSVEPRTGLPCANCQYAWTAPGGPGHCYMFEHAPSGVFCGQFKHGVGLIPPQRR